MRKESHENNQITWKESREKWIVWKELHAKINESRKKYRMRKESREKQTTSKESQVKKLIVWKELHVKINESRKKEWREKSHVQINKSRENKSCEKDHVRKTTREYKLNVKNHMKIN